MMPVCLRRALERLVAAFKRCLDFGRVGHTVDRLSLSLRVSYLYPTQLPRTRLRYWSLQYFIRRTSDKEGADSYLRLASEIAQQTAQPGILAIYLFFRT